MYTWLFVADLGVLIFDGVCDVAGDDFRDCCCWGSDFVVVDVLEGPTLVDEVARDGFLDDAAVEEEEGFFVVVAVAGFLLVLAAVDFFAVGFVFEEEPTLGFGGIGILGFFFFSFRDY